MSVKLSGRQIPELWHQLTSGKRLAIPAPYPGFLDQQVEVRTET